MIAACVLAGACLLAPASSPAGAGRLSRLAQPPRPRRPLDSLVAAPARLALAGAASGAVEVTNSGRRRVVVDVRRAGFTLDLRGRPKVARLSPRRRVPRLVLRPRTLALAPGASAAIRVVSVVPRRAEPGDHVALVLVTTRPPSGGAVAVRMRLGVVVVVRVPGRVVRRVVPLRLHVRRRRRVRLLELLVANRGNVGERLGAPCLRVDLLRRGRRLARLAPLPRELLPRSRGLAELRYRGRARGDATARVQVSPGRRCGPRAERRFHIRL